MKSRLHSNAAAALLLLGFLPGLAQAQSDTNVNQTIYLNQLYDGTPTNAPQTSLAQAASVALFSGSISSLTNNPATLADAKAPTDTQVYLTEVGIGQPAGGPLAFYLPGLLFAGPTNGTVCISPANLPLQAQAWQLAFDEYVKTVSFYVTGTSISTNFSLSKITNFNTQPVTTNTFSATWTNDLPGSFALTSVAVDDLGNSVTSAPVNITVVPVTLVNGLFTNTHSFTFLATNSISFTMTNPFGGIILYTTDGSDPAKFGNQYFNNQGALPVTTSQEIRAVVTDANFNPVAEADPVTINVVPLYPLNVSTAGGGSFTVSPPGAPYISNTVVTLTATPSNNWTFIGWTGDVVSASNPLQVTMNGTKTIQAVFGTSLAVLETAGSVTVSPGTTNYPVLRGSIMVSPVQSLYPYGSSILLTAIPTSGNYFQNWNFNFGAGPFAAGSNSPLNLVVTNGVQTVSAAFPVISGTPPTNFSLTVEVGSGSGTAAPVPYATIYASNTVVSLVATPAAGQIFLGWTGATNSSSNPLPLTMVSNTTLIASFSTNPPPTIAITSPPDGTSVYEPTNLSLTVNVTSVGSTVTNVTFFANGIPVGASTNPPFNFIWSNMPAGTYTLTATATSTVGLSATSDPITVIVNPPSQQFAFSNATYTVHESSGSVTLTVVNYAGLNASLNFLTVNGTAYGGNGLTGDYIGASGSLNFATNQTSQSFTVQIVDNYINGPNLQFQVQLSEPTIGGIGSPGTATVILVRDDVNATTNALLHQAFPTNQPAMDGALTVYLSPPEAGGQWRFPWEYAWRNSGATAANLTAGDYPVQFRNLPGYLTLPLTNSPNPPNGGADLVTITDGATATITNIYYATELNGSAALGSLTVNITPANLPRSGWQFFGVPGWNAPGSTAANLQPDTYLIAFEPVPGYVTPPSLAVLVSNGMSVTVPGNYTVAQAAPNGVDLPESLSTQKITDYADYPYGFNGQLQTDVGFGSGAAVTKTVVLTAAHMVFNDSTLSYVSNAFWSFQEQAGTFQPEPQAARGWYVLSGYASQRAADILTNGYFADQSSPASRDLDVAALYFLTNSARGGYGGFISSDAVPNPYLTGSSNKTLVGYPVDGSVFGNVLTPGLMYATPTDTQAFFQTNDQVYAASWLYSYPGNSGGPLCVQYANGTYYPAAVYLGTLFGNGGQPTATVVRAIDSSVVSLITLASDFGDNGTNNSGGGVITFIPTTAGLGKYLGLVDVQISPPSAVLAGAAWKFAAQPVSSYLNHASSVQVITNTNSLTIQFNPIPGWNLPVSSSFTLLPYPTPTLLNAAYTVTNPAMAIDPSNGLVMSGTINTKYQIQSNSVIGGGAWIPFQTNTLTNFNVNVITNHPGPGYYRALWLTNSP